MWIVITVSHNCVDIKNNVYSFRSYNNFDVKNIAYINNFNVLYF